MTKVGNLLISVSLANVRFGSKADMGVVLIGVRPWGRTG